MNAMTKGLLTIAMLAATAACDGAPTASNEFVSTVDGPAFAQSSSSTLTFSSARGTTATPPSSSGGTGSINFAGSITTPTPCYEVSASHTARSSVVTVNVRTADAGGICTQVITNYNYQGSVSGLEPGLYTFTITHNGTPAYTNAVVVE
ncbi:hypothetical protein [Longimicrobium sp.]|uniref:hypothetical protein n=1 Tax=Longimicrobium sp. TaxID=2029185 RepID=UPI002E3640AF|nr:hypothetical protein [Longimicrobium sp.]HEX6039700.1 hypothetical protein [Longimicrobium sp.]